MKKDKYYEIVEAAMKRVIEITGGYVAPELWDKLCKDEITKYSDMIKGIKNE